MLQSNVHEHYTFDPSDCHPVEMLCQTPSELRVERTFDIVSTAITTDATRRRIFTSCLSSFVRCGPRRT